MIGPCLPPHYCPTCCRFMGWAHTPDLRGADPLVYLFGYTGDRVSRRLAA